MTLRCYIIICPVSNSSVDRECQLTLKSSRLTKYKSVQYNHDNAILRDDSLDEVWAKLSNQCNLVDEIQSKKPSQCDQGNAARLM